MPAELSSRHMRLRLLQLGAIVAVVAGVILLLPGLGSLRDQLAAASPGWLALAALLEVASALSYVVIFRAVFCRRMPWRLSYQIGMAEQAANSLLPAGGAGGLALGVWALRRSGMSADHIARRTVAFFLLTSLANFATLILFAAGFALGIFGADPAPAVTLGFGAAAAVAIGLGLAVPALSSRFDAHLRRGGRIRTLLRRGAEALGGGVTDSLALLRRGNVGVIGGSLGYMAFDIAVLGVSFRAFGHAPSLGILVVAYIIGQLGGLLPIPGGIGGTEGGLLGAFALYHVSLTAAATAILAYRALQLWIPAALGSVAFVQLRHSLAREPKQAALRPLAETAPV
ncbi:MAG TPA: lysylphosphatidylglycerol synthase domain-containing protein [Solirubrobacteraceae bacterium]